MPAGKGESMKKKEMIPHKPLRELTLQDRFLFREAMQIPEVNQTVLSILLNRPVELKEKPQAEKELGISPQFRSVRLDVFSVDTEENIYSIEMQKRDTHNLDKRSRVYQSQMDVTLLPPGSVDFNEINDTFLIMICPFDLFGKEAYRYTFYPVCEEFPDIRLKDGSCRMFINTRGKNKEHFNEEFLELMDYINAPASEAEKYTTTEKVRKIHEEIVKLKQREEMGVKYMQGWEERVYDRMEGERIGRIRLAVKVVQNAMEQLGLSCEKACELAEISTESYMEYQRMES